MVQIIPQQGNIAGRIGKGFGQGLAEQIPKEVERYRLSSGLEQLGKDASNLTPFERFTKLSAIPGITPAMLQGASELLKQEGIKKGGPSLIGSEPISMPNSVKNIETSNIKSTLQQSGQSPFIKKLEEENAPKELFPSKERDYENLINSLTSVEDVQRTHYPTMSEDQKELMAYNLWNKNPQRFPGGLEDAKNKVQDYLASEREIFEAKKDKRLNDIALQNQTKNVFDERLKQNNVTDLPAKITNSFMQKAFNKVDRSESTPEKAGAIAAEEARDFDEKRGILKNLGYYARSKAPEKLIKDLDNLRNSYAQVNALPEFVEDMKNYNGLGDHLASTVAYPLSDDVIKSLPDLNKVNKKHVNSDEVIEKIAKNLKTTDSIFSLGLALEELGWNDQQVIDKIDKLYKEGKISLNARQQNEITKYYTNKYTLGDLFFSLFESVFANPKLPYTEKARRKFWGKR